MSAEPFLRIRETPNWAFRVIESKGFFQLQEPDRKKFSGKNLSGKNRTVRRFGPHRKRPHERKLGLPTGKGPGAHATLIGGVVLIREGLEIPQRCRTMFESVEPPDQAKGLMARNSSCANALES